MTQNWKRIEQIIVREEEKTYVLSFLVRLEYQT